MEHQNDCQIRDYDAVLDAKYGEIIRVIRD